MARVEKLPPAPEVEVATVTLTQSELDGLTRLLHAGVGGSTLNALGLLDLNDRLGEVGNREGLRFRHSAQGRFHEDEGF